MAPVTMTMSALEDQALIANAEVLR